MANPLPNEKELYEKIVSDKLIIADAVWELLEHHLGNDVYAISLIAGSSVSGSEKEPIPIGNGEKILKHCTNIRSFMKRLKELTKLNKDNVQKEGKQGTG